ncbi:MAG: SPFH domain-containing protein [Lachnospiraceae bacterium]|nr:SPFH domain-containing protein [Lachnospiraceae bacterium]
MGIIKAIGQAIGGSFADQWLEVYEPDDMGDQTVFTSGVRIRKGQNTKGSDQTVSNGSIIHVYDNQFMMLVDGGKIVDYTAEPGYYKVDNSALPSLFNGELKETVKETFSRIKYGGQTPTAQKVFYVNLQEIKGIKFGTRNPINYFDNFYNAELFLRAHGTYSIKITDPLRFYQEAIPRNKEQVEVSDINEQYLSEFLEALQSAINQMSADGIRISHVSSKGRELSKYMADILDEDWNAMRGMEVQSVGIASISYDEESQKMIQMRNQGAMLSDPTIREGYVQGAMARGLEAAGSNANGSMAGFMGMGIGMQAGGAMMGNASQVNLAQMQMQQQAQQNVQAQAAAQQSAPAQNVNASAGTGSGAGDWTCACGAVNTGKFCSECGTPKPMPSGWICACGAENTGKFCSECGKPKPAADWTCDCGAVNTGKFCSECGKPRA